MLKCGRALFEYARHARPVKPGAGLVILGAGNLVQQITARVVDAQLVELPQDDEVADLVGRQLTVGGAEDDRMIAIISEAYEERGCLGYDKGNVDPGNIYADE